MNFRESCALIIIEFHIIHLFSKPHVVKSKTFKMCVRVSVMSETKHSKNIIKKKIKSMKQI